MQLDLATNGIAWTPERVSAIGVKALIDYIRKHNRWGLDPDRISYLRKAEIEDLLCRDVLPAPRAESTGKKDRTAALLSELQAILSAPPEIDLDAVRTIVQEEIKSALPVKHEITTERSTVTIEGAQHYRYPVALKMIAAGVNLLFWGPAGSGKTTLAVNCARSLGIEYLIKSFSPSTQGYELTGYMSPAGSYVPGVLYDAMKTGKLLILDEFDAADPGVGLLVNSAIASREVTFPNLETVKAHSEFRVIACCNTRGTGATIEYCGRNALDAATLDRFAALLVDYDPALEAAIVGVKRDSIELDPVAGGIVSAEGWLAIVEHRRRRVEERRLPCVISPRATAIGCALFAAGLGQRWVEQATIYKSLTDDQRALLEG